MPSVPPEVKVRNYYILGIIAGGNTIFGGFYMAAYGRTDLACEVWEQGSVNSTKAEGVRVSRESLEGLELLSVHIDNRQGALFMGKPEGSYYTLHLPDSFHPFSDEFRRCVKAVSALISPHLPQPLQSHILIAALGNPDITPDSVGPLTAANVLVTRHLKEQHIEGFDGFASTILCRTGVLGTSGIESAAQIRSFCRSFQPDLVIAVDALAGADVKRLCRSIQICDSGISPGSGVGNDREELSRASLGVPVLALGVPTVIDAAALCERDGVERMFVTPRDIDAQVRSIGRLLGFGINMALHPGLEIEDMELLLG